MYKKVVYMQIKTGVEIKGAIIVKESAASHYIFICSIISKICSLKRVIDENMP